MADDDQCTDFQFKSPFLPGESCEGIYNKNPDSYNKSGYYWILSREYCGMAYTGSSCEDIYNNNPETGDKSGYYRINDKWTYCNMNDITSTTRITPTTTTTVISTTTIMSTTTKTISLSTDFPTPTTATLLPSTTPAGDFIPTCAGVGGGWKRIISIDISAGDDCPSGWHKDTYSGVSFCRMVSEGSGTCSSANFSTNGTSYQRVCGSARGYQKGATAGFHAYYREGQTIDGYYADGLLITYGHPRQHIWTYAAGITDNATHNTANCPCAADRLSLPPSFVGTSYYCESGAADVHNFSAYYFNDPLWDGSGCITSNCCINPTQPWFYQELHENTTVDIEARICSQHYFSYRSTLIDQLKLYIQ